MWAKIGTELWAAKANVTKMLPLYFFMQIFNELCK